MNRRARGITLVLTAVLVIAGCGSTTEPVTTGQLPVYGPAMPAGATTVTDLPAPSQDTSCDPTASFRPDRPLPQPGTFEPGSTMAAIVGRGKLVVGVDQNTYRFGYRNPITGTIEGFDVDIARAIAAALFGDPNAIQLKAITSDQRVRKLKSGEVDIVVRTMTINCERWQDVDFSSVYYEANQLVLVKQDSDFDGIDSLGGKKVCAAKDSTSLARIVNEEPKPIGVQVDGWTDCLVMLQQNQVDAVSTDDTILAGLRAQDPFTRVVGASIGAEPYGIAIPKGQDDFVRFVNAVLERMRADGSWADIYTRWLSELLERPAPPPPPARYRD